MNVTKIINIVLRTILYSLIIVNYIRFIINLWLPECKHSNWAIIVVFTYTLLNVFVLWSIIVTNTTNPGNIPLYWGFYMGDSDQKRKRYCLMCNVFKPERCHHCSVCNRCVLNMDHHCPWLNNCIGFFNRKFFMQMLFYMVLTLFFVLASNAKKTYEIIYRILNNYISIQKELSDNLGFLLVYFIDLGAFVILVLFFKFHIFLVLENKTTIESIDKKGQKFDSVYDASYNENWLQVMGKNKVLWFFPLRYYIGLPTGNGVDWQNKLEEKSTVESQNSQYKKQQEDPVKEKIQMKANNYKSDKSQSKHDSNISSDRTNLSNNNFLEKTSSTGALADSKNNSKQDIRIKVIEKENNVKDMEKNLVDNEEIANTGGYFN